MTLLFQRRFHGVLKRRIERLWHRFSTGAGTGWKPVPHLFRGATSGLKRPTLRGPCSAPGSLLTDQWHTVDPLAGIFRSTQGALLLLCVATAASATPLRADETLASRSSQEELQAEFHRAAEDFETAQQVSSLEPERARRLFRSAAKRFESIAAAGVHNGRLEYNLGNCFLQAGDVGLAILHSRRAERLIPGDVALHDNLSVAQTRCLTPIAESRGQTFWRNVLYWHYTLSDGARADAALAFYVGVWVLLTVRLITSLRWPRVGAVVCGLICAALGASVGVSRWQDRNAPSGVVISSDTVVLKGPGTGYQRQFEQPLQPGVEFSVRERRGSWWSIELPDGQGGWIEASRADLVPWIDG